jgi:DNA helicase-2/ATP-dependent DNA helicase PcrA
MDDLDAARAAARDLRRQMLDADADRLAVLDVERAARMMEYEVASFAADDRPGVLGYLDPDEPLIWCRSDLAPIDRAFTLAHELGHARLHRGDQHEICSPDDMGTAFELNHGLLLRPDEAYSPRSLRERAANAFASELLAPLNLVCAVYLGHEGTPPLTTHEIARACGVWSSVVAGQLVRALRETASDPLAETFSAASLDLDASQREAAAVPTPALIVAGPGTGKTSTLIARLRWLAEQGTDPRTILVMTFSRKAAQELRLRSALAISLPLDRQPAITTFHSFGAELLRSYGHLVGLRPDFTLVDEIAAFLLLRDIVPHLDLDHYASLADPMRYFGDFARVISRAKDELVEPAHYAALAEAMRARATTAEEAREAARAREVAVVYAAYQAALEQRHDADFGDLIRLSVKLCAEHPQVLADLRQRYAHVLVDEFQDINRADSVLLRSLAGPEGNIWAVGDANQAIYRFRGASPASIASFQHDYPGAQVRALRCNYRARPALVEAANRFAGSILSNDDEGHVPLAAVRTADSGPAITLRTASDGATEIAALADDIAQRHAAGTPLGAMAVLCRTRALARQVAAALNATGLAATTTTEMFEQEAIKDLLGIAHLLAGETGGVLRAARVPAHAFSQRAVLMLCQAARPFDRSFGDALTQTLKRRDLAPEDRAGLERLREALVVMRHAPGVAMAYATYLFDLTRAARTALRDGDGSGDHLADLLALAAHYDLQQRVARDQDEPGQPTERSQQYWSEAAAFLRLMRALPHGLSVGPGASGDRVHVLTVHGAKGLEFPIVFVPRLATGYFPTSRRGDPTPAPDGLIAGEEVDPKAAHRLEEACLFYVAITRARDELILSHAERYSAGRRSTPSEFLEPFARLPGVHREGLAAAATTLDEDDALVAPLGRDDLQGVAEPPQLRASAIATYLECPRQYAYRYGYRFHGHRASYWRLRHAVAEALQSIGPNTPDAAIVRRFVEIWRSDTARQEPQARDPFDVLYERRGAQLVMAGARHLRTRGEQAEISFARTVDIVVEGTLVRVELDRIEVPHESAANGPHGVRAVRHHLDRRATDEARVDVRLYLAMLAARSVAGDTSPVELVEHRLAGDEQVRAEISSKNEASMRQKVAEAVAGIRAGQFPARPEARRCQGCEFSLICPA